MKQILLRRGVRREEKYKRVGVGEYYISTINTVTIILPRWFKRLITTKKIGVAQIERDFRAFKDKLHKIDANLVTHSLYTEDAHVVVNTTIQDRAILTRHLLKSFLRLFYKAFGEFINPYRTEVINLTEYKIINNKIIYCPVGPRKGLLPS